MSAPTVAARGLAAILAVTARRLSRGPRHAGWSFRYEIANEFLKRTMRATSRLDWPAQRRAWDAFAAPGPALRRCRVERVEAGVPAVWIAPEGTGPGAPVLLWLHGGSFAYGSARTHGEMIAAIAAAAGARALVPEYRLAPEHPFPAALGDSLAVYRWLLASGVPARGIVLAGDSCGGNLALAATLRARDEGLPLPAGAALVCPWLDLGDRTGSVQRNAVYDWAEPWMFDAWTEAYLGDRDRTLPLASPIHADLHGLPPLLLQVGGAEMILDQVVRLAERARAAAVEVTLRIHDGMTHDWHALAPFIPGLGGGIAELGRFVRERTGTGPLPPYP